MFFWKKQKEKPDFEKMYQELKSKINSENSDILNRLDEKISKNYQKEWYEIKAINLSGYSGIKEWLEVLVNLPESTAIYLMPFHTRDFNGAYFIKDFNVDKNIGTKEDIQLFVYLAQKAGHAVFCDFITRFSRYAEPILENPYLARWIDVKEAEEKISKIIDNVSSELEKEYDKDDIEIIKGIYQQDSKGNLSEEYEKIYKKFEQKITEHKKQISFDMYKQESQIKLQKRVKGKTVEELQKEGLWTVPVGAKKAIGLPVFDYMNKEDNYPVFKHYDENGADISETVKNDLQTPAYFMNTEKQDLNKNVVKYFIGLGNQYLDDYGFDGLKVNYLKNTFDKNANDKIPAEFLSEFNKEMKKRNITMIAGGKYNNFREYQDLGFDIIWNENKNQTPKEMLEDCEKLGNYNTEDLKIKNLSAIKVFHDRFASLDMSKEDLLFKWFCMHFLPSGRNAKMPILYLDGDENGYNNEFVDSLFNDIKLGKNQNNDYNKKFNAIIKFASDFKLVKDGEANIIEEDSETGFVSWLISKEPLKEMLLVVANYKPKSEKVFLQNENEKIETYKENEPVKNKTINLPGECKVTKEYVFNGEIFEEKEYTSESNTLEIENINPKEYRIFLLRK